MCSLGQCVFNPFGMWRVVAFSASILPTDPNGQPWDSTPAYADPDPYVFMKIGSQTKYSSEKQDTLYPLWNEALIDASALAIQSGLHVEIWDSDLLTNELIGSCDPWVSDADLLNEVKTVTGCGRADITLMFYVL
ncbi:MAG: C2 domain-containing protein [bacterium]